MSKHTPPTVWVLTVRQTDDPDLRVHRVFASRLSAVDNLRAFFDMEEDDEAGDELGRCADHGDIEVHSLRHDAELTELRVL